MRGMSVFFTDCKGKGMGVSRCAESKKGQVKFEGTDNLQPFLAG